MTSANSRTLSCPHCHKPILNDGKFAGQVVMCPHCRGHMRIPQPQSELEPVEVDFPAFENAKKQMRSLRPVPRSEYMRLSLEERRNVFSLPGIENLDTLMKLKAILVECFATGIDLRDFKRKAKQAFGSTVTLRSDDLERVFRAYANRALIDGKLKLLDEPFVTSGFPYLKFSAVDDGRTPATHLALEHFGLNGTAIYRRDDPFWQRFMPPLTDLCRCTVIALTTRQAARHGAIEAQEWLRTDQRPQQPEWVKSPAFDPRLELEDEEPETLESPQAILQELLELREHLKEMEKGSGSPRAGHLPRSVLWALPITLEEGLALLQGRKDAASTRPPLDGYFEDMERIGMKNAPPWKGDPENDREYLETIDAIIACCREAARQG